VPVEAPRLRQPERLDVKSLRDGAQTARRTRLLASLPSSVHPRFASLPAESIDFTSSKTLDAKTCTGCMACVTACPTGALTSSRLRETIRFDGSRCVKCHLCHDVCEPDALTLADELDVAAFLEFAPKTLVKLTMVQCGECGALFKADGQSLCPRCRDQDAEARELWGIKS
jgi:ferredoxin